ncbi:hypothetical protein FIT77_04155 [Candidatus Methylopumilus universalis]|uniref:hypothetical protein n=1 Tax=Candidatus Methylopumilus universalis TaxID=2588536 RepID=UPI00111D62DA|nr:hypothetical protein [Candidatus Methylopumilus universalis]QDC96492.1 hypothetical protein FIT77_04155 [Candidatus Methylopumilus universalis]
MKKIIKFFSIFLDETVFFVLASRVLNSLVGLISIYFIFRFLSPIEQGHYYAFISLVGFSVFFEFGLGTLIIQTVSHSLVKSNIKSVTNILAIKKNHLFFNTVKNLYVFSLFLSLLMFLGMSLIGFFIFGDLSILITPWCILTILISINFLINTGLNIIEGMGKIVEIAKIRFFAMLFSVPILWISFYFGLNVFSISLQLFASILIFSIWLIRKYRVFFYYSFKSEGRIKLTNFIQSIWPLQSRLTVSFFSNYLNFQGFVPLVYLMSSSEYAGKFGVTIQALMAINGFAITWVNSKFSYLSQLAAKNSKELLQLEFKRFFVISIEVLCVLLAIFLSLIFYMSFTKTNYLDRFLDIENILYLCLTAFAIHVYSAVNIFLLAFKKDPLFKLNLFKMIFLLIGFGYLFLSKEQDHIIYIYCFTSICFSLFGSLYILNRFKKINFF